MQNILEDVPEDAEKILVLTMDKEGIVRFDTNTTNGECLWMMEYAKFNMFYGNLEDEGD